MKFYFDALGCRANYSEIEEWREEIEALGGFATAQVEEADIIVFNTCTVTNNADRKNRKKIEEFLLQNTSALIYATGCGVQGHNETVIQLDARVKPLLRKQEVLPYFIDTYFPQSSALDRIAIQTRPDTSRTRAFVKIQDGCNNFCTYCVIPMVRGREMSFDIPDIIAMVQKKESLGYKEVVLTGIHLSNWGIERDDKKDLADVITALLNDTNITRIRFGSLEPRFFSSRFLELLRHPRVCPHLHLSLQSGTDKTLSAMQRHYTTNEYTQMLTSIRSRVPEVNITTDIIVGFPGETEIDFEQTTSYIACCGFTKIHVFPYSPRTGTLAAHMSEQIPEKIKKERAKIIRDISYAAEIAHLKKHLHQEYEVLIEFWRDGVWRGYTKDYTRVHIADADKLLNLSNQMIQFSADDWHDEYDEPALTGKVLSLHSSAQSAKVSLMSLPVL